MIRAAELPGHSTEIRRRIAAAFRRAGQPYQQADLEDVEQTVWLRLLERRGRRLRSVTAQCPQQVSAFLGRVAERCALDAVRSAHAQRRGGWAPHLPFEERVIYPRAEA